MSWGAKRQQELERKREENEARERMKLEVCYDPHLFWGNDLLTVTGGDSAEET